ncbi:hypothetical protein D3C73_1582920 [compost metagenome]
MRLDFEVFREVHHYLKHNTPSLPEFSQFTSNMKREREAALDELYVELKQYHDEVHQLQMNPVS